MALSMSPAAGAASAALAVDQITSHGLVPGMLPGRQQGLSMQQKLSGQVLPKLFIASLLQPLQQSKAIQLGQCGA